MYTSEVIGMVGSLAGERYISLTTFRRDGSTASTPVWVVSDDGKRLLVWTGAGTWKVKRIRRNPRVLVAASNYKGAETGPRLSGRARVLGPEVEPLVARLLRRKYGWQRRALELQARLQRLLRRRPGAGAVCLEIR
jgi:PPOX class probable F420-dependent enzyme